MFQLRSNIFETNSSSIHTFCISRKPYKKLKEGITLNVRAGQYGWSGYCDSPLSYLYTLVSYDDNRLKQLDKKIKDFGFKIIYENGPLSENSEDDWYYVDHAEEGFDLFDILMKDDILLLNFIFDDETEIYITNDNWDWDDKSNYPRLKYDTNPDEYFYYEKYN